jgi:hypothetical protein
MPETSETTGMSSDGDWRGFLRRHWGATTVFVLAAALAVAWAVYVFWWFVGNAQSTALVPSTLGLWTMGNLVNFIIYSVLWELLLVGIPVGAGAIAAWMWWRRLPNEERMRYNWGKRSRSAGGSGGAGFLFFIAFAIKVYVDGNWNVPISTYTLNYVVGSMITILAWVAVIFGIPIAIGLAWWIRHELKRP